MRVEARGGQARQLFVGNDRFMGVNKKQLRTILADYVPGLVDEGTVVRANGDRE